MVRRLMPRSMVGQAILVLLVGLTVSHVASMFIYSTDRMSSLVLQGDSSAAQRAANVIRLVTEAPPEWRERLVAGLGEPGFNVALATEPGLPRTENQNMSFGETMIKGYVESRLSDLSQLEVRFKIGEAQSIMPPMVGPVAGPMAEHMRQMIHGRTLAHNMAISARLPDGKWLEISVDIPEPPSMWSSEAALSMLLMAVAVVVFSAWVVRKVTKPLRLFAAAAERLGQDVNAPPLPEDGPVEVGRAAHAFNDMQERLKRLIDNRTKMLAAISHDLRTPITLLRLRAELVEDPVEQNKMLETLDQMEAMIASTLAFAREDAMVEERKKVDFVALVEAVSGDFQDSGGDVTVSATESVSLNCAPLSMRRALTNVIENALKYGTRARVELRVVEREVVMEVDDDGPGIPEDQVANVFTPFVRVDAARSPGTGGVGLGLSVAQSVIHAHGGEIALNNRSGGGLRVTITLPV